jgi:hypothetical protein
MPSLNVATARTTVRNAGRNALSTLTYSDALVDAAIVYVANYFIRRSTITRTTNSLTLTASTSTVGVPATDFHAQYILRVWEPGSSGIELDITDHASVLKRQVDCPREAQPTLISFYGGTLAQTYPTTNTGRTLSYDWRAPLTSWTLGATDGTTVAVSFNIPDAFMTPILMDGVVGKLQENDEKHAKFAQMKWQNFLQFCNDNMSAGNLGAKVSFSTRGD